MSDAAPREPETRVSTSGSEADPGPDPSLAAIAVRGYEVLQELGRGGMGVVYKARQQGLDRLVALKMVLTAGWVGEESQARFRREAEALARLDHPHVVQIYEVGDYKGWPFFAAELVEGGSLAARLRAGPWQPKEAARLVLTLAETVDWFHRRAIVHRDLKPANVLLTADGRPKIADFGLAKLLDGATALTATGAVMGTPEYMAPEQAEARHRDVGPAADVYALGVILYELLTGRPPFHAEAALDTLVQVIADAPLPPSRLRPGLPSSLDWVCLKCLEKRPDERYPSAGALADDLRRFLDGKAVQARPRLLGKALRWAGRRRWLAAGLAAVILGILAAGLWYFRPAPPPDGEQVAQTEVPPPTSPGPPKRPENPPKPPEPWGGVKGQVIKVSEDEPSAIPVVARGEAKPGGANTGGNGEAKEGVGRRLPAVRIAGNGKPVRAITFAADGKTPRPADGEAPSKVMAPDGETVAAVVAGGTVSLRRAATGDEYGRLGNTGGEISALAFSPDGAMLAVARSGTIELWEVASGQQRGEIRTPHGLVRALALAPDSQTLVSSGSDQQVRLWSLASGREIVRFTGHTGSVWSVAFAGDGKRIASGGEDGEMLAWDVGGRIGEEPGSLKGPWRADQEDGYWNALADRDAAAAYQAIRALVASPKQAAPLLEHLLRPVLPPDERQLDGLIALLASGNEGTRTSIRQRLEDQREAAEPRLLAALEKDPRPALRREIEQLRKQPAWPVRSPERLRSLRAVEVLEHLNTAASLRQLIGLSEGAPQSLLTRKARAARERSALAVLLFGK
jgi:hypothetical protein